MLAGPPYRRIGGTSDKMSPHPGERCGLREQSPDQQGSHHGQGGGHEHVVRAAPALLAEGVVAHAADYRPGMRTLLVERADGVATVSMDRPEEEDGVNTR